LADDFREQRRTSRLVTLFVGSLCSDAVEGASSDEAMREDTADAGEQIFVLDWFEEIVGDSQADTFNGRGERGNAGDHDQRDMGPLGSTLPEQFELQIARHVQVGDDQVERLARQLPQGRIPIGHAFAFVPGFPQQLTGGLEKERFVVRNQDSLAGMEDWRYSFAFVQRAIVVR
jgi:hypothetical protein